MSMTAVISALEALHRLLGRTQTLADHQTAAVEHNSLVDILASELGNHSPCFPTSIAKSVRGLGHWICLNSQTVILYIYAPPLCNKHLTQGVPFQSMCTIRTML